MKGLPLFFVSFRLFCGVGFAQNLVPNPGFEIFGSCIIYSNWSNYQNTVDPFNTCNATVPNNFAGNQAPLAGNGYVALVDRHATALYHEFFGVELTSPLVVGTQYYCEMYVSLTELSTIGAANMGFQFNTAPSASMNNISQVYTSAIITNKTNWTLVSGVFTATTAYQYVAVGNFLSDALTATATAVGGSYTGAYYYIDGVVVTPIIPLPLEVVTLKAHERGASAVDIEWSVAVEKKGARYSVERTTDGKNFVHIGQVLSSENSTGNSTYSFTDEAPVKGLAYYRIRLSGNDGTLGLSSTVAIEYDSFSNGLIYPNPSDGKIMLDEAFPLPSTLEVYDFSGRNVVKQELTEGTSSCDLSFLEKGIYFWMAGGRKGRLVRN